mmetsp:Transcript_20424/g.52764  ORF Transcript_20424/g.52764 Transcript_20424/m.52764 type:complete len:318 (+) Transcript_20424:52-1005(+)
MMVYHPPADKAIVPKRRFALPALSTWWRRPQSRLVEPGSRSDDLEHGQRDLPTKGDLPTKVAAAPPAAQWREQTNQFVPQDFLYGVTVAQCSEEIRQGFLRKVYGLISAQLLVTFLMCVWFMFHVPTRFFVVSHPYMTGFSGLSSIVFLVMCWWYKDKHPVNLGMLGCFTLAIAYNVAFTCAAYMQSGLGYIVLQAFVLTAVITVSLTLFTLHSKRDFSFLGAGLFAGLMALLVGLLLCWLLSLIFGYTAWLSFITFLLSLGGAALFSLYIVFDTWMITHRMTPDMFIPAAIDIYLDIINLFLNLLRVLAYLCECQT